MSKAKFLPVYSLLPALCVLLCLNACKNRTETSETTAPADSSSNNTASAPAVISYQIVNEFPHDPTAFTEGLQFVDGYLYESTGQYGKSDLRKTDLKTGKVLQQHKLDNRYFGEGIAVLNDKIYQLTYREKTGFIYDKATLKQFGTFSFSANEGWGMTTDGTHLVYSDGSDIIYFIDPATFKEVKHISVTDQYGKVSNINELEFINGSIYANQWQANNILKIDPATGKVIGQADLQSLRSRTGIPEPDPNNENAPEVMNGIAYDAQNNRIFITGKNWPKLIEIKLDN